MGEGGWLARVARRLGEMVGVSDQQANDTRADDGATNLNGMPPRQEPPPPPDQPTSIRPPAVPTRGADGPANPSSPSATHLLPDASGRYVVGGFSFSTAAQALEYRDRLGRHTAGFPSATAPGTVAPRSPPSAPRVPQSTGAIGGAARNEPRWIGEPTELVAGGFRFLADMVYFGTPTRYEGRHDHSRVDPVLPVEVRTTTSDALLDYWPSYLGLKPQSRRNYLAWLSGGRADPAIPVGYVFLFFYGLEQRLLVDDAKEDAKAIFREVRRLVTIHGERSSFGHYAGKLLALAALYEDEDESPPTAACAVNYEPDLPLDLRIRLGRRLRDGKPFGADDTLRWVLAMPDVYLRTPGQRCFEELRELWSARFAARHPDGLAVRKPRSTVKGEYRAASGKFTCNFSIDELPDISGTSAPLGPLRAMLDACMEDLSQYSRTLGREPETRDRLRGDLLLPAELRAGRPSLVACRTALSATTAAGSGGMPTALELARLLDVDVEDGADKLPAIAVRQMGQALDALDHGFEPDRRYGASTGLRASNRICVFPAAGGAPVDPERPAYAGARGTVEVAILAAGADGEVVDAEVEAIERRLRATPDLGDQEIARLLAYGRSLAADPPKVRAALKRLAETPPAGRAALAASAVEAVLADGRVEPAEVRFLEALHVSLQLPTTSLYAALHRGGAETDAGPVLVVEGSEERTVPLPAEQDRGVAGRIDAARLDRIRGETSRVSALLASIFVEDEAEPAAPKAQPRDPEAGTAFAGLDAPHSRLLAMLLAGPMDRAAFDAAATGLRLMPEGALEALNEWGFDRFDEPVVEDDGDVRIAEGMTDRLTPVGVAA